MNSNPFASDEPDPYTETATAIGVIYSDAQHHPHPRGWVPAGTEGLGQLYPPPEIEREWAKVSGWESTWVTHVLYLVPAEDFSERELLEFRQRYGLQTVGPSEFQCEPADIEHLREAAARADV
ncbi:hypothetical protein [Sphaerimonospora mesophila]|uniref:hypothetical protein n=1 Tax=Sphaerimonospora mesophila TaxID=37483 RepID=UPI000A550F59